MRNFILSRFQRHMTRKPLATRNLTMRRSPIMLALAATAALSTAAQAQTGPGTIYYQYGSPSAIYSVNGNGTQNVKVGDLPANAGKVSALSTYPGGRQFQRSVLAGTIPGTTKNYFDMVFLAEATGAQTTISNFRGPQYIEDASRYFGSNDHQDSFCSFMVYDAETGERTLYRYNGPLADLFAGDFTPFVSDDPRLAPVANLPNVTAAGGWDGSGTRFFYQLNQTTTPFHKLLYVLDMTTDTHLINDPAVSGFDVELGRCSSTELRLFGKATATRTGVKGIVSFYPATGQFNWVVQEGGKNANNISSFSSPSISPDGTVLAFGLLRIVNGQTRPTLVRIPVSGGSYTPLVTFPANSTNTLNAGGEGWTW
jgi:hypothetical protein